MPSGSSGSLASDRSIRTGGRGSAGRARAASSVSRSIRGPSAPCSTTPRAIPTSCRSTGGRSGIARPAHRSVRSRPSKRRRSSRPSSMRTSSGPALERASDAEVAYLRALAVLGPDPQRASEVAEQMGRSVEQRRDDSGSPDRQGVDLRAETGDDGVHRAAVRSVPAAHVPELTMRRVSPPVGVNSARTPSSRTGRSRSNRSSAASAPSTIRSTRSWARSAASLPCVDVKNEREPHLHGHPHHLRALR